MLTHIVRHIFRMPRPTNFKLGWYADGGRRPASATGAMTSKVKGQSHKVTWSVWAVLAQWPINRERIVVVSPKFAGGYPMTRATLRTSFKVKRSKIRVTGRLTQTKKMCHIFRTARPKNFKLGARMEDVDPHQRQAPWPPRLKIKITRSQEITRPRGPYYEICSWYSDKVPIRVRPTIAVTSKVKVKVISSHLNSGNKMLYLCH